MKLKDIKLETLRMMGVTAVINDEDLTRLAADEECKDYMAYMPGAINRCFSNLEGRDVLPIKRAVLSPFSGESYGGGVRYELPQAVPDLFKIERIAYESQRYGYTGHVGYTKEGDTLLLREIGEGERYIILYRPRLRRITSFTDDETELDIPENIASLVPYFVKSELFRQDEPDEAQEARNWYEGGLADIISEAEAVQTRVQSVYGAEML